MISSTPNPVFDVGLGPACQSVVLGLFDVQNELWQLCPAPFGCRPEQRMDIHHNKAYTIKKYYV